MTSRPDLAVVRFRILIIGGGVAGLSTAVSLARRGHSVLVLETIKEFKNLGAGVALPPPIVEWYESEGVLALDDPLWGFTGGFENRHWDTGTVITRTAAGSGGNLVSIHRGDLQWALLEKTQKLENVEVRLGARVVDLDVDVPAVVLENGQRITGDLIIVADGVNSTLKWKVCPSELEMAQPTGDAAYRLVLPRELLNNDEELEILINESWIKRWDGPGGHVIVYPVHNMQVLNVVLIHPDDGLAEESWKAVTDKHHVVTAFERWDPVLRKLIDLAPEKVPNFQILTHSPSPAWAKGSAILLGDACHAMPPFLSQGVGQAVEDAIAITVALSGLASRDQLPAALQAYETSRKKRVTAIQEATFQARKFAFRKGSTGTTEANQSQDTASDVKSSQEIAAFIRSAWGFDAAEAARTALDDILRN